MGRKIKDIRFEALKKIRNNARNGQFQAVAKQVINLLESENPNEKLIERVFNEVIEPAIKAEKNVIPKQFESMIDKYAWYLKRMADKTQSDDDLEESIQKYLEVIETLKRIENPVNSRLKHTVERKINTVKLIIKLLKDGKDIDSEDISQTAEKIIEEEKDNRKEQESTSIDIIESVFIYEVPANTIADKLKISGKKNELGTPREETEDEIKARDGRSYGEELKAEKRWEFLSTEFDIEDNVRICNRGIFSGCLLISLKNSDLVILERVFNFHKDKTYTISDYGSATYILPKNKIIEMINMRMRRNVKEEMKDAEETPEGWKPIRHDEEKWKQEVKKAIEEQMRGEQSTEVEESEKEFEDDENNSETEKETKTRYKGSKNIIENIEANRQFIEKINQNIGGFLTEEIIEKIIRRTTSYTFENVYETKLKERIYKNLELLEIPEESKELEAQKVFLVMRMTMKNFSGLQRKFGAKLGIEEEELDKIIEAYCCKYETLFETLKNGIENGREYKEIIQVMSANLEESDIPVHPNNDIETPNNEEDERADDDKNEQYSDEEPISEEKDEINDELDIEDNQEGKENETPQSDLRDGANRILDDLEHISNDNPLAKLMQKMADILRRMAELEEEQKRINKQIEEIKASREGTIKNLDQRRKEYVSAKNNLEEARRQLAEAEEQEQLARKNLSEATQNDRVEEISLEKMAERGEQIAGERKELEEKVKKIEEFLDL